MGSAAANTAISPGSVYTVPSNKRTIIKSVVVFNNSSSEQRFTISLAGYPIIYNHVIKPFDSMLLPAAGFILNPIESLSFGCTSSIALTVTGIVFDATERNNPYIFARANGLGTLSTSNQVRDTANNILIKSVTFCNVTGTDTTIALSINGSSLMGSKLLRAYDTLTIPFLDQLLIKNEYLQAWASAANAVVYHATGIVVT